MPWWRHWSQAGARPGHHSDWREGRNPVRGRCIGRYKVEPCHNSLITPVFVLKLCALHEKRLVFHIFAKLRDVNVKNSVTENVTGAVLLSLVWCLTYHTLKSGGLSYTNTRPVFLETTF